MRDLEDCELDVEEKASVSRQFESFEVQVFS